MPTLTIIHALAITGIAFGATLNRADGTTVCHLRGSGSNLVIAKTSAALDGPQIPVTRLTDLSEILTLARLAEDTTVEQNDGILATFELEGAGIRVVSLVGPSRTWKIQGPPTSIPGSGDSVAFTFEELGVLATTLADLGAALDVSSEA